MGIYLIYGHSNRKQDGKAADLGVGILFADKPMWGSTQSFGAARLKSLFLLDDLDEICPVPLAIDDHHEFSPKERGRRTNLKTGYGSNLI